MFPMESDQVITGGFWCHCRGFQVLQGLDYLHTCCKIIHTDIKPENILLCQAEGSSSSIPQVENQAENQGVFKYPASFSVLI